MQIGPLREKDLDEAVGFAVAGMHFDAYLESPLLQRLFFKGSAGVYDEANREMLGALRARYELDGEIIFLAANPAVRTKGVGTILLGELAARERGKRVFLFTDDLCTYQFYEHRGFELADERATELDMRGRKVPLRCLLYTKVL